MALKDLIPSNQTLFKWVAAAVTALIAWYKIPTPETPLTLPQVPVVVAPATPVVAPVVSPAPAVPSVVAPDLPPATPPAPLAIKGPTSVQVGEIAEFSAPLGDGARVWQFEPEIEARFFNDKRTLIVPTSKPDRYVFFLTYLDKGTLMSAKHVLVVEGARPPPVVDPVDPVTPSTPTVPPAPTTKATAATYVYEKDQTAIPPAVMSGLNRLNREKKILATLFEQDATDGSGEVPDQYKLPLAEAKKAGTPALVVTADEMVSEAVTDTRTGKVVTRDRLVSQKVLKVIKAPITEEAVLEAAQ